MSILDLTAPAILLAYINTFIVILWNKTLDDHNLAVIRSSHVNGALRAIRITKTVLTLGVLGSLYY